MLVILAAVPQAINAGIIYQPQMKLYLNVILQIILQALSPQ